MAAGRVAPTAASRTPPVTATSEYFSVAYEPDGRASLHEHWTGLSGGHAFWNLTTSSPPLAVTPPRCAGGGVGGGDVAAVTAARRRPPQPTVARRCCPTSPMTVSPVHDSQSLLGSPDDDHTTPCAVRTTQLRAGRITAAALVTSLVPLALSRRAARHAVLARRQPLFARASVLPPPALRCSPTLPVRTPSKTRSSWQRLFPLASPPPRPAAPPPAGARAAGGPRRGRPPRRAGRRARRGGPRLRRPRRRRPSHPPPSRSLAAPTALPRCRGG